MTPREREKMAAGMALPDERAGVVMWWSASAIEADPAMLRAAMAKHAPRYVDLVRAPVGPHTAMRRALRRCASGMPEGYVWREVGVDKAAAIAGNGATANETELVIAYAHETTDIATRSYTARDEWTMSVNDTTDKVTTSINLGTLAPDDERVTQHARVMERYRKERLFLTQEDLRALMLRIFLEDARGSRLKSTGSIYFLPAAPIVMRDAKKAPVVVNGKTPLRPADEIVDEMAPVLEQAGLSLWRVPILKGDATTTSQIAGAVGDTLLDEIEAMAKEARDRVEAAKRGEGKLSTLQARLEAAGELRTKARLYRDLLGLGIGDAEKALAAAEELIEAALADAAKGAST